MCSFHHRLALLGALLVLAPSTVHADGTPERWLLAGDGSLIAPVSAPQRDWYRPGLVGGLAVHRSLHPKFLLGLRYQGAFFPDGPPPQREGLVDPGVGTFSQLHLSLRLRPLGRDEDPSRLTGLWVAVEGGGGFTGSDLRMSGSAAVGWGFEVGRVTLAPVLRYTWVYQPSGNLDSSDAHVLALGLEVGLFDGRRPPPPEAEEPEEPPPSDRDGDGFLDPNDACPDEPEDVDSFEDDDGCPEPDNDGDGILDGDDRCPFRPEDMDGFQDEDGCPDPDNDLDGFPDDRDRCPTEAEVVNGVEDDDGCPDEGLVTMVDDRVVLEEQVLFDFQRARVKSRAAPVIAAIVEMVRQHPDWTSMRVEGHADVRGQPEFNQSLSERRARNTMRALIEAGLPADRIDFMGYGETRPRDLRTTEAAHQRNRRVEFVVLQRRELTDDEIDERERALEERLERERDEESR
ncbi:MAG: hypothetical protein CMN30_15205 [Sandaracinus sp.]|nr:hypothetical protein [Sandaracinus sp.]|tara:strand:- start:1108 stop:2484 length:1377 start_codon:yes stop_codon:yes gene_type:complete